MNWFTWPFFSWINQQLSIVQYALQKQWNLILNANGNSGYWTMITAFATIVTALATVGLFWVGWKQLRGINKTANADFIHRFKMNFFTEDTRFLINLIESKLLIFRIGNDKNPYFKIKQSEYFPISYFRQVFGKYHQHILYSNEIDDLLLGPLEDVGLYLRRGNIDIEMAYETFSYYVEIIWDNSAIKEYIAWLRWESKGTDTYDNFKYLYIQCKSYRSKKALKFRIRNGIKRLMSRLLRRDYRRDF